jgi:hypothetical protein
VMRKLSMASIASNFSRRSPSFSSISNSRSEDSYGSRVHKVSHGNLRANVNSIPQCRPAPAVVDFHNAPAAFLPTDFEIQDTRTSGRRQRLSNRTNGAERSVTEKPASARPKRTRRLSSHIISLPRSQSGARLAARSTSHGSNATVLRRPEASAVTKEGTENDTIKRKGDNESSSRGGLPVATPSKKFLKSKSRIFKFWV